ncbi:hypothetical protein ACFFIF_09855 [Vagococcus entomophilus]|uniref:Uncharacterized protein n=1 Tax=Vagococcus entomophilus TaxID=1160095 RepID=A0A430AGC9_9ENTE|nr:hypothetical protein [Vagococcus entomophilus]RSU06950.1 hypothetical protein CBF30_06730 [Vagococcus entomophilus]
MNKKNILLLSTVFICGQVFMAYQGSLTTTSLMKKSEKLSMQTAFISKDQVLWELVERPKDENGVFDTPSKEINYIYKKTDLKKWELQKSQFLTINKKISLLKKQVQPVGANGDEANVVASIATKLSGKILFGDVREV